jgi:hypothetical protein
MPVHLRVLITVLILHFISSCKSDLQNHSGFYYWNSQFTLSNKESQSLSTLRADKLYLHYFDVSKDKLTGKIHPESVLHFENDSMPKAEIIPVVYIDNEVLKNITDTNLTGNIFRLVESISNYNKIIYSEVQFDCDWTESTKDAYFDLLRKERVFFEKRVLLSTTIRLHQIKYADRTGVPPVDRGMLMYYNMGNVRNDSTGTSILNNEEGSKYLEKAEDYPLPLDVAFPVYSWAVIFRNGKPIDLLHRFEMKDAISKHELKQISGNLFAVKESFPLQSVILLKNDLIKIEAVSPEELKKAASLVAGKLKPADRSIIFFDLNEKNISRISNDEMEAALYYFN